jgi:uncharacterized protein (TIGR00369 family)
LSGQLAAPPRDAVSRPQSPFAVASHPVLKSDRSVFFDNRPPDEEMARVTDSTAQRTRSYTWEDPMIALSAAQGLTGLEYMQRLINGEFPAPPISITLGFELVEVEEGRAVFAGEAAEYLYNPIGSVHGGFAATLLDSALGCAVHTTLPANVGYTTLEIAVNYVRPITATTGRLFCEGMVIHAGRRIATAEAKLTDADGKLYAHGKTTCAVFTPEK